MIRLCSFWIKTDSNQDLSTNNQQYWHSSNNHNFFSNYLKACTHPPTDIQYNVFLSALLHESNVSLEKWVNISHEPSLKPIISFTSLASFQTQIFHNLTHASTYQISCCFSSSCGSESLYFQSKFRPFWQSVIMMETFFLSFWCQLNLLWTLNLYNSLCVSSCAVLPLENVTWKWLKSHWEEKQYFIPLCLSLFSI